MNREEAISELKYARAMCEFNPTTGEVCFRNEEDRRQAKALDMAIEALRVEKNCEECEVGNPCLYCKHQFEPQEESEE